jgi:hypothetical protein
VEPTVLPNGSYYLPASGETIPADMATPSLMIASTVVPLIQEEMSLIHTVRQHWWANLRLDASLLQ